MRRTTLGIGLGAFVLVASCTTFSGDDSAAEPSNEDTSVGDAGSDGDGGHVNPPPVSDTGIGVQVEANEQRIVQGKTLQIPVTLTRGKDAKGAVAIKVSGLRAGLTAKPLTIEGDKGVLELSAAAEVSQGPATATIEGALGKEKSSAPLSLFVRGPAGSLDTTFGKDGYYLEVTNGMVSGSLVIGPQNTIYASFGNNVRRLTSNGVLDTTYGDNGLAVVASKMTLLNQSAALTADGGLLFAGSFRTDTPQHGFGKLTSNGAPDLSFGDGKWGAGSQSVPANAGDDAVGSFVPLANGNIVFTATSHIGIPSGNAVQLNLLNSVGKSVPSFGTDGHQNFLFFRLGPNQSHVWLKGSIGSLYRKSDGSIFISGMATDEDSSETYWSLCNINEATGDVNPWFGQFGCVAIPPSSFGTLREAGMVELPDGKIVVAFSDWQSKWSILRLAANGDVDKTFGKDGWGGSISVRTGWRLKAWTLLADGFLLTEQRYLEDGIATEDAFIRVTKAGEIDTSFGKTGRVELDNQLVEGVSFYRVSHVATSSDGKILVRGNKTPVEDTHGNNILNGPMFVARYWN